MKALIKPAIVAVITASLFLFVYGKIGGSNYSAAKNSCIANAQLNSGGELAKGLDIEAYCGCMAEKKVSDNTLEADEVEMCMDAHVRKPVITGCRDEVAPKLEKHGVEVDCQCVYNHLVGVLWDSHASRGVELPEGEKSEINAGTFRRCIIDRAAETPAVEEKPAEEGRKAEE